MLPLAMVCACLGPLMRAQITGGNDTTNFFVQALNTGR